MDRARRNKKCIHIVCWNNSKEDRHHFEDTGIVRKLNLKRMLKKQVRKM